MQEEKKKEFIIDALVNGFSKEQAEFLYKWNCLIIKEVQ